MERSITYILVSISIHFITWETLAATHKSEKIIRMDDNADGRREREERGLKGKVHPKQN